MKSTNLGDIFESKEMSNFEFFVCTIYKSLKTEENQTPNKNKQGRMWSDYLIQI